MKRNFGLMIGALLGTLTVACSNPTAPTDQTELAGTPSLSANAAPVALDSAMSEDGRITTSSKKKTISLKVFLAGRTTSTIDFGGIPLGATKSALLQITSTGSDTVNVTSLSVPDGYTVTFPSRPPLKIKPSQTQSVTITFSPNAFVIYKGTVFVNSDATGGTKSLPITGTGIPRVSFGAGTWIVNQDIQPGRYYTSAAFSGANPNACFITAYNVNDQEIGGIGTLTGALQQIIDIPRSVYYVKSPAACGTWSLTPSYASAIFGAVPEIHPGEWDVEHQIVPGTYTTPTPCSWDRMQDCRSLFPSSVIKSGISTTVTVQPGDSGFLTHGCVWTLQR